MSRTELLLTSWVVGTIASLASGTVGAGGIMRGASRVALLALTHAERGETPDEAPAGRRTVSADDPQAAAAEQTLVETSWVSMQRGLFDEIIGHFASCPSSFVGAVSSCWPEADPVIGVRTACTVAVERGLDGAVPYGSLVLRQEGGCLDGACVTAGHSADLEPGMRAALGYRTDETGLLRVASVVRLGPSATMGPDGISLDEFAARIAARRRP